MAIGNNIGMIGGVRGPIPESSKAHRQVYQATHLSDGRSDSFINRSFISFSYGGKNIEDFNLLACINGDRMERQLTGNFNDLVTSYDVVNGQYYWGTYFSNNEMSFTLVTDGITQPELENFIHWFAPGQTKELILAEHPNRAIMARVAAPPTLSTIPFEEEVEFMLEDTKVKTIITLYKGEINLQLVMDSPFWYSKLNLLVEGDDNRGWGRWTDANGESVLIVDSKDALKIIYEDNIPTLNMADGLLFDNIFFLGNNLFFKNLKGVCLVGAAIVGQTKLNDENSGFLEDTSLIGHIIIDQTLLGCVPRIKPSSVTSLESGEIGYLYYAGTAPTRPQFTFNFQTLIENNKVSTPRNYNSITLTGSKEQKMLFGIPSVFYGYNQIIDIFNNTTIVTYGALRERIRERVHHYYVKKWASYVINYVEILYNNLRTGSARVKLIELMKYFLLDSEGEALTNLYLLDADNNKYAGILGYRIAGTELPLHDSDWVTFGEINSKEEDISEIIKSDYIILSERNHLREDYGIGCWSEEDPTLSYKITHDFGTTLNNFAITYQNKYY